MAQTTCQWQDFTGEKAERSHLRPLRNSIFRKDSFQGREERQADEKSMISVWGNQYSAPTKYRNKVVEIYFHPVALIPGQKVIAREYFRQKDKSARKLKKEVLAQFSFPSWWSFAKKNFKAFPRYVRDHCLIAQKHFNERTDLVVLEHAIEFKSNTGLLPLI